MRENLSKKYIIAIDGGSQSSKVTIFDLSGKVVCFAKQDLRPAQLPAPGHVEHPDDDLWDSIVVASKRVMQSFQGDTRDIVGVGLCTLRFCRVLIKEDGTLAAPVLSWMDERVSRPYQYTNPTVKYVTTTSGYITNRMTAERKDTAANYMGQWPIDSETWQWSRDSAVIEHFNLPTDMLFELHMPGTILGHVTKDAASHMGIPAGIPVVATANDKAVEALGAGLVGEHTALISLGTYIAGMVHGDTNRAVGTNYWRNFASVPGQYLYESNGIRRGMWTVSWFRNLFGDDPLNKASTQNISVEDYWNQEAARIQPGSEGLLTLLDWLAPTDVPYRRGLMIGFNAYHTRAHIYRSLLEAVALTMKNHVTDMCSELGFDLKRIILSGGGAGSDAFTQIFSDVFGLPVSRNVVSGSASLGAAICVAVGLGYYESYADAVRAMVRVHDTTTPNPENYALYQQINDTVYKHIPGYIDPLLKKAHRVFA